MAVNITVVNNATAATRTVNADFAAEVVASSQLGVTNELTYYFKLRTSVRDTNNNPIPVQLVQGLDELALNGTKQSAANSAADYSSVTEMVNDYVYDIVNGHAADKHASGVSYRAPMDLT